MSDSEEEEVEDEEEEEDEDEEEEDEEEEEEDEDGDDDDEDDEDEGGEGAGAEGGGEEDEEAGGGGGGWADKLGLRSKGRNACFGRCKDLLFSSCLQPKVQPVDDDTAQNSDNDEEAEGAGFDLPPPDMRVTLHLVSTEEVKVHDFLAGSNPYLLIKPDGLGGKRPMRRTVTNWKIPNAAFDETFEIDMCLEELPLRIVVWDHMEEIRDNKTLNLARAEYASRSLKGDPREGYMQFVEVPDMDVPPEGSSAGMSSSENGPPISDRKRAMPRFTELPDAIPENMKQAWFPVRDPPLQKIGGDVFEQATNEALGGYVPVGGLVVGACYQRLDPATGELLDAVGDLADETEMDRRALHTLLRATSDPPKQVWQPLCNWNDPEVIEDVTLYSGAKTELRRRVRTHDEKTGELLLPEELPRVVKLDVANCTLKGTLPVGWFDGRLGPSLAALDTLYLNNNLLEGNDLPHFASLQSLKTLDLSENSLRGDLHALELPPSLEVLNLDSNYLKGPIDPSWFEGLPNITILRLSGNRLKCEIPRRCWHFMPKLRALGLAKCNLEGPVHASIADAKLLEKFTVADNEEVDGEVPSSFLELVKTLQEVSFAGCARLGDSNGVVAALRDNNVAVQVWGTAIADPS